MHQLTSWEQFEHTFPPDKQYSNQSWQPLFLRLVRPWLRRRIDQIQPIVVTLEWAFWHWGWGILLGGRSTFWESGLGGWQCNCYSRRGMLSGGGGVVEEEWWWCYCNCCLISKVIKSYVLCTVRLEDLVIHLNDCRNVTNENPVPLSKKWWAEEIRIDVKNTCQKSI